MHNIRCARTSALPGRPCAVGLVDEWSSGHPHLIHLRMDNLDAAAGAAAAAVAAAALAAAANSCPAAA